MEISGGGGGGVELPYINDRGSCRALGCVTSRGPQQELLCTYMYMYRGIELKKIE